MLVHWPAICIGIQTGPYKTDTWVLMTREQPRARCSLCGGLEPRGNNSGSAERAKRRRLEDKAEMERIKEQNAMLQTRAADVEARFAALASEYNKLQLQRNLVLSLGANPERNLARWVMQPRVSKDTHTHTLNCLSNGLALVPFRCSVFRNSIFCVSWSTDARCNDDGDSSAVGDMCHQVL